MLNNTTLKNAIRGALFLAGALTLSAQTQDFSPSKPECIAPAKPGGCDRRIRCEPTGGPVALPGGHLRPGP